jgi:hypothetical protein
VIVSLCCGLFCQESSAKSKNWTITERQEALNKDIKQGVKSGELTAKEGDSLTNESASIEATIVRMKGKNDGKLSYKDEQKLEKKLNSLSLRIQKLKLDKRVQK